MPVAIPLIVSAIGSAALADIAGTTILGLTVFESALVIGGANLVLGAAQSLLTPKVKKPSTGDLTAAATPTTPVNQSDVYRRLYYGENRVAGAYMFWETSADNVTDYVVQAFASQQVQNLGTIYFDGEPIHPDFIDGDGNVITGKYKGAVKIKKYLGTDTQSVDPDLIAGVSYLTGDFRLQGTAYILFIFTTGNGIFPNGIPQIQVELQGGLCYDPRDSGTRYTVNTALCIRDYMVATRYGPVIPSMRFDDDYTISESNICDEFVTTLPMSDTSSSVDSTNNFFAFTSSTLNAVTPFQTGDRVQATGGTLPSGITALTNYYIVIRHRTAATNDTYKVQLAASYADALAGNVISLVDAGTGAITLTKNGEPRYTCNGFIEVSRSWRDIVTDMLTSMGGSIQLENGLWVMLSAVYRSPTISYDDDDVAGSLAVQTKVSRQTRFNAVEGSYVSPINFGQTQPYPFVQSDEYALEDNGNIIYTTLDLPFTSRASTCQRLGTIYLNRARQQVSMQLDMKITGLLSRTGDTIEFSNSICAWSNKLFEIASMSLVQRQDPSGAPLIGIQMVASETESAIYDYDPTASEIAVLPLQKTNLPNPEVCAAPGAITLASGDDQLYLKSDGTVVTRMLVNFIASVDKYVLNYEVQYRKSGTTSWSPLPSSGLVNSVYVWDVQDNAQYDVQVRAVNFLGVKSTWVTFFDYTVLGKSAKPPTPDTFLITRLADGTRQFDVALSNPPADVRVGGGFEIRYALGTITDWTLMTPLTTGIIRTSPFETNQLAAGTYTFAAKTVDSSGNESTDAEFIQATIGNPRLSGALVQEVENPSWPGTLVDCFNDSGTLLPDTTQGWDNLPSTWSAMASTWDASVSANTSFSYITENIDVGFAATFLPLITVEGRGTITSYYAANTTYLSATNLLTNPADLSNASWTKTNVTITTNPTSPLSPDGSQTADEIIETATTAAHKVSEAFTAISGDPYTFVTYLFAGTQTKAMLELTGSGYSTTQRTVFDLVAITATGVSGTATNSIEPIGDGWYKCSITSSATSSATVTANLYMGNSTSYLGVITNHLFAWNTQIIQASSFSPWNAVPSTQLTMVENIRIRVDIVDLVDYPYLDTLSIILDAQSTTDSYQDINTVTNTSVWYEHTGTGHFKIASSSGLINTITQANITALQNVGPGFTWELISKSATIIATGKTAAEFKVYNSSGTLTDATVDLDITGV